MLSFFAGKSWSSKGLRSLGQALVTEEDEYFSRERIFSQFVADDDAEGVETFTQVAGAGG